MPINNELITQTLNKLELKRSELVNEERKLGEYIHVVSSIRSQNDDKMPLDGKYIGGNK